MLPLTLMLTLACALVCVTAGPVSCRPCTGVCLCPQLALLAVGG